MEIVDLGNVLNITFVNEQGITETVDLAKTTINVKYDYAKEYIIFNDSVFSILSKITVPSVASMSALEAAIENMLQNGTQAIPRTKTGTPVNAVAAQGTLTLTADTGSTILNNKTVTVGGKVYTFKTALTPTEGEVLIGANDTAALANLKKAINHEATDGTNYKCAAANANVTAVSSNATTIIVENKVKGVIGNESVIATDIAGAWDDTVLGNTVAGVDGTVGQIGDEYIKSTQDYAYKLTADNTIADANWRKYQLATL